MTTPTYIMAVPWEATRARRARELADETGGLIVWDETHNSMRTFRALMLAAGSGPGVFLEDDVYLAPSWRPQIEQAIAARPDQVIQFFSLRAKADLSIGSREEPGRTFLMNQCYYLPAGVPAALVQVAERWPYEHPADPTGYDTAMADYFNRRSMRYWMHIPSLVQHEKWKSTIHPNRPRNRQSPSFKGAADDLTTTASAEAHSR